MAAIRRALVPLGFHNFTRIIWETSRHTLSTRYVSRISSLQPVFPSKQDVQLFEDASNEYSTIDADVRQLPKTSIKTHPCDALASAAIERNEPLANALLEEYQQAGIDIVLRPEYEELANANLLQQRFDAFFVWLSLLPPVGGETGILFPKNTHMVEQISRIRLPFDQMYRLMYLFGRKGWSGPVPNNLVSILAQYTDAGEFMRLLAEALSAHRKAHGSSEEVRWIHAEWRNRAIQEFCTRNDPETAFTILAQSPLDVVEFDPKILGYLDRAAARMRYPIPAFAQDWIKNVRSQATPRPTPLRNVDITNQAFNLRFKRADTMSPIALAKSRRETVILLRKLKQLFVSPPSHAIDPRSVAFFLYTLTYTPHSQPRPRLLDLFRTRTKRLGSDAAKSLWATVEVEMLLYRGDAHAALLYYNQTFLPINVPFFLNTHVSSKPTTHWEKWMTKKSLTPIPPAPADMPLRPSALSTMSVWKAAITLAIRDPDAFIGSTATSTNELHGAHAYLTNTDESGVPVYDVIHLTDLFREFLILFDTQMLKNRTFFSNPFTRVRYFELFLRRYVQLAPAYCASIMAQIQERDVPLDHRIWAVYARSKVDAGEPRFVLDIFELLQRETGQPLDFSPTALKNWETVGMRGGVDGHGLHPFTLAPKVLNSYAYALRQLLRVHALPEALELHARILEAGYREGTSVSLDRLVYQMLEELQLAMREPRIRLSKRGTNLTSAGDVDIEGEVDEAFSDDLMG